MAFMPQTTLAELDGQPVEDVRRGPGIFALDHRNPLDVLTIPSA